MMRLTALLLLIPLLAACSSEPEATDEPTPAETMLPVEPGGGIGDGAEPLPRLLGEVPEDFRGIWDHVEGNCNPASDLRLEIAPRTITFYESFAEITRVSVEGDDAVTLALAMSGEGENWKQVIRFKLLDDGTRMIPSYPDEPDTGEGLPLKRCPK